jgi:hypothetical protein
MSINMMQFETLRNKFPSWVELKAHFESEEGGKLRVVEQDGVAVIRYEKGSTSDAVYRSLVWDTSANLPLCVAPFRANEGAPPTGTTFTAVEDFVDGFMMNVWVSNGSLHVSTRTRVGGANKFYSDKTFGELFAECVVASPLKTMDTLKACLEEHRAAAGATAAFASFVLQHPEHRIVAKVAAPSLNTVHTGYVTEKGVVHISERAVHWPQALARLQVSNYPPKVFQSEAESEELLRQTAAQRGWRWQGLVFKDGTGGRWRMRTPTYTMLRELRGGESSSLERFFRLRAARQVVEYLKHYGEERHAFWEFEQALRARTADVLAAYTDVHKAHTVAFKDLPEALRPAVYLLHLHWRDELRAKGFSVRLQNVIGVVNKLRGFEKKRLMDSAAYVPVTVKPSVVIADAVADAPLEEVVDL